MQSNRMSNRLERMPRQVRLLLGALTLVLTASAGWHFAAAQEEEAEVPAVGVRGIFPLEVPRGLGEEAWAVLAGHWERWGAETGQLVTRLYEDEQLDVAGQRGVIDQLRSRIRVMDKALADPRYRSIHGDLLDLRARLVRRVDLAEAVLDSFEIDPAAAQEQRIERARRDLGPTVARLRDDLRTIRGGAAWLGYLQADRLAEAARSNEAARREAAAVAEVAGKFARRDQLQGEQREFFQRAVFDRMGDSVRALNVALAPPKPTDPEALRPALAGLVESLEQYEETRAAPAASAVRSKLKELEGTVADGGARIREALRGHYVNYNLHIVASEGFLSRLMNESRQETGAVQDHVMEAAVSGWQTTNTTASVDLRPRDDGARFAITLRGVTQSNTTGVTSQATIYTQGYHQFWGSKEIRFDGDRFATLPAQLGVAPHNQTVGARTGLSGFPLLGRIADRIAVREAQKRRPQSEAHAASRLYERAYPRFDSEVDQEFAEANRDLADQNARLKQARVYPETKLYRTTDQHLQVSARVREAGELGGGRYNHTLTPGAGVTLHVHESLANNSFDRMNIAGRTMTEQELVAEFERFLGLIAGRTIDLDTDDQPASEEDPAEFIFAETDPLRVRFEGGVVSLTLKAGLRRPGEEDIPTQEVTVPLRYTLRGNEIVVTRGTVAVAPVGRPPNLAVQVVRAGVMRDKIQRAIPERTRDRQVKLEREGEATVMLFVTQLEPRGGWLTLSLK
ncbi:MAG: hypothetical protein WD069_04255 [Planctomycetales bacterium]